MSRKPRQMRLDVRRYIVRVADLEPATIQAASPEAAKYAAFLQARDLGYFSKSFGEFITSGVTIREDCRS